MDYQRFVEQLPSLYIDWEKPSVQPKTDRFQIILNQLYSMPTANVLQLLNFAVECMEPDEVYCEVGCGQGATLIGALLDHPTGMAYAIDQVSETDPEGINLAKLTENLSAFDLEDQVYFFDQDFESFFAEMQMMETSDKIGLYFYNSTHDYRSQLMGLLQVRSFLADRALIVVSDSHYSAVQQASWDFIATHPQCQHVLELPAQGWNHIHILSWDINRSQNYDWHIIQQQHHPALIQAMHQLHLDFEKQKLPVQQMYLEAQVLQRIDRFLDAEKKYREILQWDSKHLESWQQLGILYYTCEQYEAALETLNIAIELAPNNAISHHYLGLTLAKLGQISEAITEQEQAIKLDLNHLEAYLHLGQLFSEIGEVDRAEVVYQYAISIHPDQAKLYIQLGKLFTVKNQLDQAMSACQTVLKLHLNHPEALQQLGEIYQLKQDETQAYWYLGYAKFHQNQFEEALNYFQQYMALQEQTHSSSQQLYGEQFYIDLAYCYKALGQAETAIEIYRKAISLYPNSADLYSWGVEAIISLCTVPEVIEAIDQGLAIFPNDPILLFKKQFTLPTLYNTEAEIEEYRKQYIQHLNTLTQVVDLNHPEVREKALLGVGRNTAFFLHYQGKNDRELQIQYGQLVHQIMTANYPQFAQPLSMPPLTEAGKIRIGYVSGSFCRHTVGKLFIGWLRHADRTQFELHCYHTHSYQDVFTKLFQLYSDQLTQFPHVLDAFNRQEYIAEFEKLAQKIVDDRLHILIFPDIGMHQLMAQLGALRLAPVQCVAWGHPVTTGLPTIDYFLSSELMEPDNGQAHYSEKLVLLPNISIAYEKPKLWEAKKTRSDFQIREDATVYFCCQSLFKCLPQYDDMFPRIAQRVPNAQFVFISDGSSQITELFQIRMQQAFASVGLSSDQHCMFLPRLFQQDYYRVNQLSDIFLDTFAWSGGNTTLEALSFGLPVVTCPGEMMRSRHSYAILQMLGVTETIAQTKDEYIDIAVQLGLDADWRNRLRQTIFDRHPHLYNDRTCVRALENFYRQVVGANLAEI